MQLLPQEIEVWYVLPAIRKEMVNVMAKKGLMQKDIAKIMDATEASVSQYVNGKRGSEIKFDDKTKKMIEQKTNAVIKNPKSFTKEVSELSKKIMNAGVICKFHKKTDKRVPAKCCVCS